MRGIIKKILCFALISSLISTMFLTTTFAANTPQYTYELNSEGITLTGYLGAEENIVIPSEIDGYNVTEIGENCIWGLVRSITLPDSLSKVYDHSFFNGNNLEEILVDDDNVNFTAIDGVLFDESQTRILKYPAFKKGQNYTIPNSVKEVAFFAFYQNDFLQSVIVSDSVTKIEVGAFESCHNLTTIVLSNSLETIETIVFDNCISLTAITIPNSVISIAGYAFSSCSSLSTVNIANNVQSIDHNAFTACESLKSFDVDVNNRYYSAVDGVLFNQDRSVLIIYPAGKLEETYKIPSSVAVIGPYAFNFTALKSLVIPSHVKELGSYAFSQSQLQEITLSDSLTTISGGLFSGSMALKSVDIPSSVTSIEWLAFEGCTSLEKMTISQSVKFIQEGVFSNCIHLNSILVDSQNTEFSTKDGILFSKDFTKLMQYPAGIANSSYTVPSTVKEISSGAFANNAVLEKIVLPEGLQTIKDSAFSSCANLNSINLPGALKRIEKYAFISCNSLVSIVIPNSIETLEAGLFIACTNLKQITIPNSVKTIQNSTFDGCKNLTQITIPASVTWIGEGVFQWVNPTIQGYPNSVAETYAKANNYPFVAIKSIAKPTISAVYVDGQKISCEAYNINGNNYFKLRDIAMLMNGEDCQFDVYWDAEDNSINISKGTSYISIGGELTLPMLMKSTTAKITSSKIYVDGILTSFSTFNINGNNYFQLRDLGKVINFAVVWNPKTQTISIDTDEPYTE